ncbi:MAG: hypothetical protein ACJAZ9_001362 [Neolewinella sp.]|jgi:hypothetical protein
MKRILFFTLCALFLAFTSCTEPITVGSDLLAGEQADLGQVSDLPFTTTVVREDSILSFDASANAGLASFTFGQVTNDVFGQLKHGAYIIPSLPRNSATGLVNQPLFAGNDLVNVDSVVLFLPIDTSAGLYGNGQTFPIRMGQLVDPVDQNLDYSSNLDLFADFNDLNRDQAFTANFNATLLYDTIISSGDSVLFPHIRVAFDDQFLDRLNMADAGIFENDTTFWQFLAGMYLEPTDESGSLITLQPQPNNGGQSAFAGIFYFYTDTIDMEPTFYRTPLSLWLPSYEQDYTGTAFGDLDAPGEDNETFAVAGQAGFMTAITFTDLSALQNVVINEAQFTFYREDVEGLDYLEFPSPNFIAMYYRNDDGLLLPIEDRQRLGNPNSNAAILQFLGGNPLEDDDGNTFYAPRLSVHMQRIVDGELPPTIYLRVIPVDRDPSRMALAGPQAAVRPASVLVTFTRLD